MTRRSALDDHPPHRRAMCGYGGCVKPELLDGRCIEHLDMPSPSPVRDVRRQETGRIGGRSWPRNPTSALDLERTWMPAKEDAPCCMAHLDHEGRPPIGFCGPDCVRRRARAERFRLAYAAGIR